jgi:hypothetical protein
VCAAEPRKILARCNQVRIPGGTSLDTPILIPSFSSKGFRIDKNGSSEVRDLLEFASEWLTDSMLISAYDIHHGHLPKPAEMPKGPELTVVDSGGYEARIDHDLSTSVHSPHTPQGWSEEMLIEVLDSWPKRFAATFVSYDHPTQRRTVAEQIEAATAFFVRYPNQLHTILLKPETDTQKYLTKALKQSVVLADNLAVFDFIGVTEKELGNTIQDRMVELAQLRLALDEAGVTRPIHVFGALDPLTSCLYFLAGAEVFDGLTWLRYAYRDGLCVYQANHGVLSMGCDARDDHVRAQTLTGNVHYLRQLRAEMRKFTLDGEFTHFKHNSETLRSEFDSLRTKLKGRV